MAKKAALSVSILLLAIIAGLSFACGGERGDRAPGAGQAGSSEDHRKAANELMARNDWQGAVNEYTLAIEGNQKSDLAFEGRGNAYAELGQFDKATADLSRAIEIAPSRAGPYFARGGVYRKTGEVDKAIADLTIAVGERSKTRFRGALYERGLAYKAKGNVSEARADFERIIQLEREKPGEADKSWADKAAKEMEDQAY
ncbi:MAG: tetratricopeptide repeat protein [Chloroflexi bacterium]|nr:tetratricopeptide repeat protein [Chloroflexota bacterium]